MVGFGSYGDVVNHLRRRFNITEFETRKLGQFRFQMMREVICEAALCFYFFKDLRIRRKQFRHGSCIQTLHGLSIGLERKFRIFCVGLLMRRQLMRDCGISRNTKCRSKRQL